MFFDVRFVVRPEELLDTLKNYVAYMSVYNRETPKLHLLVHPILRSSSTGNPRCHACWMDESANKTLKHVLRNVSQLQFESVGLQKLQVVLAGSREASGRKRPAP